MKKLMLSLSFLLVIPINSAAQTAAPDPNFQPFWSKFKAAVAANDKEAVASMTKLPFLFDSKEQTRAAFLKIYPQLFDLKVRKCFPGAKVLKEGDVYEVFCAKRIFYFGNVDGRYMFTEFAADN
jgi:hypothetical protein